MYLYSDFGVRERQSDSCLTRRRSCGWHPVRPIWPLVLVVTFFAPLFRNRAKHEHWRGRFAVIETDGSRALAQKDVGSAFTRDVVNAFIAQSRHIDVVQEMFPGTQ